MMFSNQVANVGLLNMLMLQSNVVDFVFVDELDSQLAV